MGMFGIGGQRPPPEPEYDTQGPMPAMLPEPVQPEQFQGGLNIPMLAQQNADLIRWQLESGDVLITTENILRGNVLVGGEWVQRGKPLMNDEGIRTFVGTVLGSRFHKGIILSNFKEEDIRRIMYDTETEVINLIAQKHSEFEIDYPYFDTIKNIMTQNIYAAFLRALEGATARVVGKQHQHIEQVIQSTAGTQKRGGLLGNLMGTGRR